jgi:uncharacterized alpha-E superfamily protein
MEPVFGNRLDAEERAHWVARIRARPNAYVAQELVQLSQAPTIAADLTTGAQFAGDAPQLQPRTIGLRVYAVASANGYHVLPGGLARVAGDTSIDVLSMQRGGSSKDTWILGETLSAAAPVRTGIGVRDLVRQRATLSSRAAENLFWLGRYAERVDCNARLLRVAMTRLLDGGDSKASRLLMRLCLGAGLLVKVNGAAPQRPDARLLAAIFDQRVAGCLVNDIQRTGRAAMHARERISVDHWQAIERLQDVARRARQARPRPRLDLALSLLERVLLAGATLQGYTMDDMVRDAGWRFLVIGRRIERIQCLARVVQEVLATPELDAAVIESLLDIADSTDTWRQRYLREPELLPALDIVVFDANNPHALLFQAGKLSRDIEKLRRDCAQLDSAADAGLAAALDAALAGLRAFDLARLQSVADEPHAAARRALAARLLVLQNATAGLSDQLGNHYFTHVADATSQSLAV